ncbi:hypothetical protein SBBP2_50020 [Burkholderiales bacterium]|nr:hypothetical protein SBBP2_50020 [Burkholderiales bacterium]
MRDEGMQGGDVIGVYKTNALVVTGSPTK